MCFGDEPGECTMSTTIEVPPAPLTDRRAHLAFFYRDAAEYLGGMVPFVHDGLEAGEPVAVVVPTPQLGLLRSEFDGLAGVDLIDMADEGRNPGRIIPGVLKVFTDAHAGRPVRIVGEPIWAGRTGLEYPACAQHEARVNLAFADSPVSILCPYDTSNLDRVVIDDAGRTHPCLGSADDGWYDSDDFDPVGLLAEYNVPLPAPPSEAITFDFDPSSLGKARRFAAEEVGQRGVPDVRIPDVVQVVGELAANSLVHGGGRGRLQVWTEHGQVVCEVHDAGHIRDPMAGHLPAGNRDLHGRGLLMVNLLSDLVRMHTAPGSTTVRAYFALPAA
jgi:anti-sigma regulatory factor (Ser/Thr protein kinase)